MNRIKILRISAITLFVFSFSFVSNSYAQSGILFQKGLSWEAIKNKAKLEHKYIFLDCYATWCGPCKFMANNVFTSKEVGDFMNDHFIAVSVQMDKTAKDIVDVKLWYDDAAKIGLDYSVNAYPTFLFFSPDGQPVHRIDGALGTKDFLAAVRESLNPDKQNFKHDPELLKKIASHKTDSAFLRMNISTAIGHNNYGLASIIFDDYIHIIKQPLETGNLEIMENLAAVNSSAFAVLLSKRKAIENQQKNFNVDWAIINRINQIDLPVLMRDTATNGLDWEVISTKLTLKYPEIADEVVTFAKLDYYTQRNKFENYCKTLIYFMEHFGYMLTNFEFNRDCWDIFSLSDDRGTILKAVDLSKKLIDKEKASGKLSANDIDTYANLLYKSGDAANAIIWENTAVKVAEENKEEDHKVAYMNEIEKMKDGQKTW